LALSASCYGNNKSNRSGKSRVIESIDKDSVIDSNTRYNGVNDIKIKNDLIWDKINGKVNWFKDNTISSRNLQNVPSDFKKFYLDFLSDSLNQQHKIDFNRLIG